jgi:hypothetical protein
MGKNKEDIYLLSEEEEERQIVGGFLEEWRTLTQDIETPLKIQCL